MPSILYPPFIPVFGAGAPGATVPHSTIYYDTGTTPFTPYIYNAGAWHKFGAVGAGADATSIQGIPVDITGLNSGQVLVYNGTDWVPSNTGGYSPGTPPTKVQVAHSVSGGNSATFAGAPTNGNLLVAMAFNPSNATAGAGWTAQAGNTTGTDFGTCFTKVAGAGESATQSPCSGVGGTGGMVIWELHGQGATPFVYGLSQAEQTGLTNQPILLPNLLSVITLSCVSVVTGNTITAGYNVGTQDVLDNSGTRNLIAGHTDLSVGPMGGILAQFSGSAQNKGLTCLITA